MMHQELYRQKRRREMRKKKATRAAAAVAAVLMSVCVIAGAAAGMNSATPGEATEDRKVVFHYEDADDFYVSFQPVTADETPELINLPTQSVNLIEEYPEENENELIEKALLELGYLSDEVPLSYDLQDWLRTYCGQYDVPYTLALAVIEAESTFVEDAVNDSDYGLMQINSINAADLKREIGVDDLSDPVQNVHAGVYMLSKLYEKYGDWEKALIAYNYGESGAAKNVFSQGLTSTAYSQNVLSLREKWKQVVSDD